MQLKLNVFSLVSAFIQFIQNTFFVTVIADQINGGSEFRPLQYLFKSLSISHRINCPYSHQQNRNIKCCHRHIVENSLFLLSHASIPLKYWTKAFQVATYLINRLPTPIFQDQSPFEMSMDYLPD